MWVEGGLFHTETRLHDMASRLGGMIQLEDEESAKVEGSYLFLTTSAWKGPDTSIYVPLVKASHEVPPEC